MSNEYRENFKLGDYTTFKCGGSCSYFFSPRNTEELKQYAEFAKQKGFPILVFGEGSNLLISDKGVRACVVDLKQGFAKVKIEGCKITAGAGAKLWSVIDKAINSGLSGLEDCYGIPGTIGGALCGNAGVPKRSIGDVVVNVTVLDENNEIRTLSPEECGFRYRHSELAAYVILSCELRFVEGDSISIRECALKAIQNRRSQPGGRTAGSVFKNPQSYSAGFLLDTAGMKGTKVGKAEYSDKHANFIVNTGDSSSDIFALIQKGREEISRKYGINLETEIQMWGFNSGT